MSSETSSTVRSKNSSWKDPSPPRYDRAANSSSSSIASDGGNDPSSNASPAGTPLQTPLDTRERNDPLGTSAGSRAIHCRPDDMASPTPLIERANPFDSAYKSTRLHEKQKPPTSWKEVHQTLALSSVIGQPNAREMQLAEHCFSQIVKAVEAAPVKEQMQRKDSGVSSPAE